MLEVAFDRRQLCFIYDSDRGSWVVRVLDDSLRGTITLTDSKNKPTRFQPPGLTWELVDGAVVKLAEIVSRRALLLHAYWCAKSQGKAIPLCADDVRTVSKEWVRECLSKMELFPVGPDPALD